MPREQATDDERNDPRGPPEPWHATDCTSALDPPLEVTVEFGAGAGAAENVRREPT